MKLAINPFPHWRLIEFQKLIGGPKLPSFEDRDYGAGVGMFYVELTVQNPQGTNQDFSTYWSDVACAQFSILMPSEIEDASDRDAFEAITTQLVVRLSKALKRRKIPNFDASAFLADLDLFIRAKIDENRA